MTLCHPEKSSADSAGSRCANLGPHNMAKKTKNDSKTKKTDATEKKKSGVSVVKGSEDQLSEDQLEEVAGGIINSGDPDEGGEGPYLP